MNNRRRTIAAFTLFAAALGLYMTAPAADPVSPRAPAAPEPVAPTAQALPEAVQPVQEEVAMVPVVPAARVEVAAREKRKTWADDRVMVRPGAENLETLATRYGVQVLRDAGPAGIGALSLPEGSDPHRFAEQIREDGLAWAGRLGLMHGATQFPQYHIDAVTPPTSSPDLASVVVAVLDTGVAYETYTDALGVYVPALTLSNVPIVAPWDFVNDDAHANDDHHHGTHMASIIASEGSVTGVAAGVGIMPVKVLDAANQGNELDLIDGILYAVDHGADVINMSLSFELDYVLSGPLGDALQHAHDQGVVMVAAAGNDSANQVTYPAAYPPVVGVIASSCDPDLGCANLDAYRVAPYSNRGPGADVIAPGGNMDIDTDDDGMPDGILAETFATGQPTQLGWYVMAGTSQAAAVVSGAAAHILAAGGTADSIVTPLRYTAAGGDPDASWQDYNIVATPQIADAVAGLGTWSPNANPVQVTLLPYLTSGGAGSNGQTFAPNFRVQVMDVDGSPMANAMVYGTLLGGQDSLAHCMTNAQGVCTISGSPLVDSPNLGWALQVDAVVDPSWNLRDPLLAMFATDGLEEVIDAMAPNTILGFRWVQGTDPEVGDVEDSYVAFNNGSGLTTSPMGLIFPTGTLNNLATTQVGSLSFANEAPWGDGLASEVPVTLATFDGSGLTSSPFGFVPMHPPVFNGDDDGSGVTSPFGGGWVPVAVSCPDPVGASAWMGTSVGGSRLGNKLANGGWMDGSSVQPASALIGPDGLDLSPDAGEFVGSGATGAVPWVPTVQPDLLVEPVPDTWSILSFF